MTKQSFSRYLNKFVVIIKNIADLVILPALVFFGIQMYQVTKYNQNKLDNLSTGNYPLKYDSPQNVLRDPPVFHLGEEVVVEATFNNISSQDTKSTAVVHWILVEPTLDLNHIDVAQFGLFLDLKPGCTEQVFVNKPPTEVEIITKKLFEAGNQKVTWRLAGDNVILVPSHAGTKEFSVESFSYVPDSIPLPDNRQVKDMTGCENL